MSKVFNLETGKYGEKIGVTYLRKKGYKILEINYRCPLGEIDVVTKCKGFLVFVEIKARFQSGYGLPEEAVHKAKQRKIAQIAAWYLKQKSLSDALVRFDVLSIILNESGTHQCRLIENAFEVES